VKNEEKEGRRGIRTAYVHPSMQSSSQMDRRASNSRDDPERFTTTQHEQSHAPRRKMRRRKEGRTAGNLNAATVVVFNLSELMS
jgi:hypothetical protein